MAFTFSKRLNCLGRFLFNGFYTFVFMLSLMYTRPLVEVVM